MARVQTLRLKVRYRIEYRETFGGLPPVEVSNEIAYSRICQYKQDTF